MNASLRPLRACLLACLLLALSAAGAVAEKSAPKQSLLYEGKTAVAYVSAEDDTSARLMLYGERPGQGTLLVYPLDDPPAMASYAVETAKKGVPFVVSGLAPARRYVALLAVHGAPAERTGDFPYLAPIDGYAMLSFTTPGLSAPQDAILMAYGITATSARFLAFTTEEAQVQLTLGDQTFWLRDGRCFQLTRMQPDSLYALCFTPMRCPCDTATLALPLRTQQAGLGREPRPVGKENSPAPPLVCPCGDAARCEANGCAKQPPAQ